MNAGKRVPADAFFPDATVAVDIDTDAAPISAERELPLVMGLASATADFAGNVAIVGPLPEGIVATAIAAKPMEVNVEKVLRLIMS